ncbi:hypothetical protein C4Y63_013270 [Klebsiella pneumoniae subsp. pneumoniae]|nr:hypothetical protein C4Y63_013270 [Klebsiella pneumoniae subsp. pneumoniae]
MTQSRRPEQAQRRRARTAGAEPLLFRVTANALPDLHFLAICSRAALQEDKVSDGKDDAVP